MIRHKKVFIIPFFLIAILIIFLLRGSKTEKPVSFETAVAATGSIAQTISATGTVEPIDKVEVGTQVSGVVKKIYVDYNSTVHKDQLLAELDKTPLLATLDLNIVALKSAEIEAAFQKTKYERISKLFEKNMVSQQDLDQAKYDYERAKINVEKAASEVKKTKLNLSYATIYSPIDGTVLSRAVDEGQTVAASLNAPTLFTIAQDLLKMEVYAAVDEADIGQVKKGQRVTFTVDAFPDDTFSGNVSQVRLQPTVTSNVVTYTVTILAQNPSLKLMPGMTATITVFLNEVHDVLTIPVRALKFRPDESLFVRLAQQSAKNDKGKPGFDTGKNVADSIRKRKTFRSESKNFSSFDKMMKRLPGEQIQSRKDRGTVWVKNGDSIGPVHIKTGLADAIDIQIIEGLKEGDEVVLSVKNESIDRKKTGPTGSGNKNVNPFMPQRPGHNRRMR